MATKVMDTTKVSHSLSFPNFCSQKTPLSVIYPVDFKQAGHIVDDVSWDAVPFLTLSIE